jgi:GNAT superfamily N-acetyltransferase
VQHITGLPDATVLEWEAVAESAIETAMQVVMDAIADRIAKIRVASGVLALVAAGEDDIPATPPVPPNDGLPPGQPYVSADDLAAITPLWQEQVVSNLLPVVAQVWQSAAGALHAGLIDATGVTTIAPVGSLAAETYLAQAKNTFDEVGDGLWANARQALLDGFERGESIPQLAERLRGAAVVPYAPWTVANATLVARTQVIEASNAGSFAMAQASGLGMRKEWIDTGPPRTRETHLEAGAKYQAKPIPLNEPFIVGGFSAMFPAQAGLPPEERYNCRCTVGYVMTEAQVKRAPAELAPSEIETLPGTSDAPALVEDAGPSALDALAAQQSARVEQVIGDVRARADQVRREVGQAFDERFGLRSEGVEGAADALVPSPPYPVGLRIGLRRAKTPEEVTRAFQVEAKRITGRDVLADFDDQELGIAKAHAEGALRVLREFPDGDVIYVSQYHPESIYASTHVGTGVVGFNADLSLDATLYRAKLENDRLRRYHLRAMADPAGISAHETMHRIHFTHDPYWMRERTSRLLDDLSEAAGLPLPEYIEREIGGYALNSMDELIAEASADAIMSGPAASELSQGVLRLMREAYARGRHELPQDELLNLLMNSESLDLNRLTIAQLRQLARERGIAVAARAKKSDLVSALREGPPDPPIPGAALPAQVAPGVVARSTASFERIRGAEARAVARQAEIDRAVPFGEFAARVDELVANGASRRALLHTVGTGPARGLSEFDVARLRDLVDEPAALRAAAREIAGREGIELVGATGDVVRFDRRLHQSIGADIADGTPVQLIRPATRLHLGDEVLPVERAAVQVTDLPLTPGLARREAIASDAARAANADLEQRVGTGVVESSAVKPEQGVSAVVRRVQLEDGSFAYRKAVHPGEGSSLDTEYLANRVGQAIGAPVPAVFRANARTLFLEDIEGTLGREAGLTEEFIATDPDARLIGLMDALIGNSDRAAWSANTIVRDGKIIAIDNAPAQVITEAGRFRLDLPKDHRGVPLPGQDTRGSDHFAERFIDVGPEGRGVRPKIGAEFDRNDLRGFDDSLVDVWREGNDLTPVEVATMRQRLEALRPEFVELKKGAWLDYIEARLDAIASHSRFAEVSARPLAKLPVGELRALAKERGIPVPTGTKKADLVKLIEAGPAEPLTPAQIVAAERKALRDAARERNRVIESAQGTARLLAEVDELIAKGAEKAVIRERLDPALIAPGQIFGGADPAALESLRAALATGDTAKLRAAITKAQGRPVADAPKAKIKPIGKAGAKAKFDPATMESVGGIEIPAGADVVIVRRGSTLTLPDGTQLEAPLARAQVVTVPKPSARPNVGQPTIREFMDEAPTYEDFYAMETMAERYDIIEAGGRRLAKAIDGEYAGLRVEVTKTNALSRDFILIEGKITDPVTGKKVGDFTRSFTRNADTGEITAGHAKLVLSRDYRGSGFAEQFNQNLYDWYRRSGITKVDIHANIDVGAYAWASKGFEFSSPAAAERLLGKAQTRLTQALAKPRPPKGVTRQQLEELQEYVRSARRGDILARAFDLSQFGREPGQGGKEAVWPGKWLLLDKTMDWHGVMYL